MFRRLSVQGLTVLIFIVQALLVQNYAQSFWVVAGFDGGVSYDADAKTYFNAMITPLSADQKARVNTFVEMVKDTLNMTNLSDRWDVAYLFANETSEAGLKNLVKRSHDATIGSATVTFTADQGFAGNGSSGYINTNYNPNDDHVKCNAVIDEIADFSMGIYSRTDGQQAGQSFGVNNGAQILALRLRHTNNHAYIYAFGNTQMDAGASTNSSGFFVATSENFNKTALYRNGAVVTSNLVGVSTTYPDYNLFISAINAADTPGSYVNYQFSFFFLGDELTATEIRGLNNCIEYYMDSLGTGVQ